MDTIKLYKYFFEVENFIPRKIKEGETRRSLNSKAHTTIIGKSNDYWRFEVNMEGVTLKELSNLYKIQNLLYDEKEYIELIDPSGNKFEVIIPLPYDDSVSISGSINNYTVNIILEEKGGEGSGEIFGV